MLIFAQNLKTMTKETSKKNSASALLEKNVKEIIWKNKPHKDRVRSLAELAKVMEISAPSLTHALKGNPRLDTIEKIADALNVPVARLFTGSMEMEGYISINGHIVHFYSLEELKRAVKATNW